MSRNQIILLSGIALYLFIAACKHDIPANPTGTGNETGGGGTGGGSNNTSQPCDPNTVYFRQQVLPILVSNCAKSGCHDEASHKEDVILTSYANVMATGGIKPGNAADSDTYEEIIEGKMPPPGNTPLTQQQKTLIYNWIQQGASDKICQNLCDTSDFKFSTVIQPLINNKCQGCHSGASASGGIDLSNYNNIKTTALTGRLWGSVNHLAGFSPMPKNGSKLSDCELTQLRKWMDAGALNN